MEPSAPLSSHDDRIRHFLFLASRQPVLPDLPWWTALTEAANTFSMHDVAKILMQAYDTALRRGERFRDVSEVFERRVRAICATLNDDDATVLSKLILVEFAIREEAWLKANGPKEKSSQAGWRGLALRAT